MPDFTRVETATYSPTCCALCRCPDGPFVAVSIQDVTVATPGGPFDLEGHVYVCLGRPPEGEDVGTPGCAMLIARAAGCADPLVVRGYEREIAGMRSTIDSLAGALEDAKAKQVVPLAEVEAGLARSLAGV